MEKFFEIIAKSLSEFFQTTYIAFFQLSPSKDELILKYASGFHPESLANLRRIRSRIGIFQRLLSEVGTCGEEKNFQIENEISKHEKEFVFWVRMDELESMIGVPLFAKGEIYGVLAVFSREKHKFKKQDGEVLSLWGGQIAELQDFFSSYLKARLDEGLVQILGNIELLKFKLRNEKTIQTSEILDALKHLEDVIIEGRQSLDHLLKKPIFEEKLEEKPAPEIFVEEVVTIEGEKRPHLEKRKVLIVDDQPIITDLLVDILKRMGFTFEVALGGKNGLKMFARDGFDLVITDLGMPDISGWEVSKSVKEQNPYVPVILITAWGVEPDSHKVKDSGVDFVINKPFQIDQLEKTIRDLIDKRKAIG
jgi:CheY-like chemotaxis protein